MMVMLLLMKKMMCIAKAFLKNTIIIYGLLLVLGHT